MKGTESVPFKDTKVSFPTHRQPEKIALHITAAGEGCAVIVASVPAEEDAALAAFWQMSAGENCCSRSMRRQW